MPPEKRFQPASLESQCFDAYMRYLYEEVDFIQHIKYFENKSVLLRKTGLSADSLIQALKSQLAGSLKGILHEIVRQKMLDAVVANLHGVVQQRDPLSPQQQLAGGGGGAAATAASMVLGIVAGAGAGDPGGGGHPHYSLHVTQQQQYPSPSSTCSFSRHRSPFPPPPFGSPARVPLMSHLLSAPYSMPCRHLPILQLLELAMGESGGGGSPIQKIDLGRNKQWSSASSDTERMTELARTLWKIIGERCRCLEVLVIPKELPYSSTLNAAIRNNSSLTHLTLKRNVPSNMFLSVVGNSCPNLKELDIAGAEVVTDFGVVCLLFADPEQILGESWNKEKTVGGKRSQRAFPHPHFDKPIPDPSEYHQGMVGGAAGGVGGGGGGGGVLGGAGGGGGVLGSSHRASGSTQYLHLKRSFHEVIRDTAFDWERLPICQSLGKIRLENTKVKGDGASVVLECCPDLFSLGYLVFAAAGLKQVFGYERRNDTKFTEIFYRGPSDQKLLTIANCCPSLTTMFLGSNSVRRMNVGVFSSWQGLQFLTLENIVVSDVSDCLRVVGKQLRGLKVQCVDFDLTDVAQHCVELQYLIIQKESPKADVSRESLGRRSRIFPKLRELEVTSQSFSKGCFDFVMSNASELRSVKILHVPGLRRSDLRNWVGKQPNLHTLVLFRVPELTRDAVDLLLTSLPSLVRLGDFASFDLKRPQDVRKMQNRIAEERLDLTLVESESMDEKHFTKLLSLHWFYLTEAPIRRNQRNQ